MAAHALAREAAGPDRARRGGARRWLWERRSGHASDVAALPRDGHRHLRRSNRAGQEERPEARFLQGDLLAAGFGEEFDAIAAFYVVDHVERERHAAIFERFHRRLRPSGWLLLSIEPEAEPGSVRDWLGQPMFFSQYDAETTLELIRAAGFEVVEQAVESQLEGERPVFFLWVLARKARLTSTP